MVDPKDDKVAEDEARRLAQHEQVKRELRDDVQQEIRSETARPAPGEREQAAAVGRELKSRALHEVVSTEAGIGRARRMARFQQVVDYVFFLVYGLIGLQVFLELAGAREAAGFKQLLNAVTAPLLAPFRGLLHDPAVGSHELMLSYVVALIVYLLVHLAVRGLLKLVGPRKIAVA